MKKSCMGVSSSEVVLLGLDGRNQKAMIKYASNKMIIK